MILKRAKSDSSHTPTHQLVSYQIAKKLQNLPFLALTRTLADHLLPITSRTPCICAFWHIALVYAPPMRPAAKTSGLPSKSHSLNSPTLSLNSPPFSLNFTPISKTLTPFSLPCAFFVLELPLTRRYGLLVEERLPRAQFSCTLLAKEDLVEEPYGRYVDGGKKGTITALSDGPDYIHIVREASNDSRMAVTS